MCSRCNGQLLTSANGDLLCIQCGARMVWGDDRYGSTGSALADTQYGPEIKDVYRTMYKMKTGVPGNPGRAKYD